MSRHVKENKKRGEFAGGNGDITTLREKS